MIGAVDIGGTKMAAGLVSADGRILVRGEVPSEPASGFDAAVARLAGLIEDLCLQVGERPKGIGIGCTGPIDPNTGVFGNVDTLPGFMGCGLTEALRQATGLYCVVENDGDAHALGEYVHGSDAGASPFLMVTIGTGIGCALIQDGQIYRGLDGLHPEMGHHSLEANGPLCVCGARGCWEALASGPSWEIWYRQAYPECVNWSGRDICAAAEQNDPRGLAAVAREGFYLGVGLANLINLFAPQAVALGGGVMERFDLFEPFIRAEIRKRCAYLPHQAVRISRASLGVDSGILGAAEVWKLRQKVKAG